MFYYRTDYSPSITTKRNFTLMKLIIFATLLFSTASHAALVKWTLVDFVFSDGGTAEGYFIFDTVADVYSDINILTTQGDNYDGTSYGALAGDWGNASPGNINVFTTEQLQDYTNASWFRIDADIDFKAQTGDIVNQWLAVGAESYCTNSSCSSAANPHYRDTMSGYLVAEAVPLPASAWLFISGCFGLIGIAQRKYNNSLNLTGAKDAPTS